MNHSVNTPDDLRSDAEIQKDLREIAADMDESIACARRTFGSYVSEHSSVVIIEHQLNKRDLGEEPRVLREAANALERAAQTNQEKESTLRASQAILADEIRKCERLKDALKAARNVPESNRRASLAEVASDVTSITMALIQDEMYNKGRAAVLKALEVALEALGEIYVDTIGDDA